MKKGDELLGRLVANDPRAGDRGVLLNDLLHEFFQGYPVDNLRPLFTSADPETVKASVWLASELGSRSKILLRDIATLLQHNLAYVRFFATDCLLTCATEEDGPPLAAAMALLGDAEASVRWKAMDFLARASPQQLRAALDALEHDPSSDIALREGVRWLLDATSNQVASIVAMLGDRSTILRKFGFAAALRISRANDEPLRIAAASEDLDIGVEASRELEMLQRLSPTARSRPR